MRGLQHVKWWRMQALTIQGSIMIRAIVHSDQDHICKEDIWTFEIVRCLTMKMKTSLRFWFTDTCETFATYMYILIFYSKDLTCIAGGWTSDSSMFYGFLILLFFSRHLSLKFICDKMIFKEIVIVLPDLCSWKQ